MGVGKEEGQARVRLQAKTPATRAGCWAASVPTGGQEVRGHVGEVRVPARTASKEQTACFPTPC